MNQPAKAILRIASVLLCLVLVASCGTRRSSQATTAGTDVAVPLQNIVQKVNANRQEATSLTAKANISYYSGDKRTSIGGVLRMKRNDVIQLSLVTFGILEVARIEITPDYFMVVNKVGKQYVKAMFQDIPFLQSAQIDFYTLQSLFWGELFLLTDSKTEPAEKQFSRAAQADAVQLQNTDSPLAVLTFLVGTLDGLVRQVSVAPHRAPTSPYVTWDYTAHAALGDKQFPVGHNITIAHKDKPIRASLQLSSLRTDAGWQTRTQLPSQSYQEISIHKLFSLLNSHNQ